MYNGMIVILSRLLLLPCMFAVQKAVVILNILKRQEWDYFNFLYVPNSLPQMCSGCEVQDVLPSYTLIVYFSTGKL